MKRYLIVLLILSVSLTIMARSPLTFEERVKAQEAIERVYYNHRIWPKENPQPKPSFEKMVTKEQIEAKVTDYLKKCSALDQFWQRPIEGKQLQAEMDRMAKGSKDPATLNELFAALNNDPYLIAECLARPVLADRLIHNWYANDERFHKEAREEAEEALRNLTPENFCGYPEGQYGKMRYKLEVGSSEEMEEQDPEDNSVKLDEQEFVRMFAEIPEEGKISDVIEKNDYFVIIQTIEKNEGEIEINILSFQKAGIDEWLNSHYVEAELPQTSTESESMHLLPTMESSCTEGWDNGILDDVLEPRVGHTAVWTGSEMIVWGGYSYVYLGTTYTHNTGGRYSPATDTWSGTSNGPNCPSPRSVAGMYTQSSYAAIWTGLEMIIWGGYDGSNRLNSGRKYDPSNDIWIATSTGTNCPSAREYPSAVWTGSEMIVWGGYDGSSLLNTGGKYNPSADSWTTTSTDTNCPAARRYHTAVWTGSEMIVWGGLSATGGRYNPSDDSWRTISTTSAPAYYIGHTAVWTGNLMIIWGGATCFGCGGTNTGGNYDPNTDSWKATSTSTNCPCGRSFHTAVWTGIEMIIWGGYGCGSNNRSDGSKYYPESDIWVTVSNSDLSGRRNHTAVWTGTEMIVWGGLYRTYLDQYGCFNDGGRYNPKTDSWTHIHSLSNVPYVRLDNSAVWTGSEMIIWGGNDYFQTSEPSGARYIPATDSWTYINCTLGASSRHTAIWTGSYMIVWGGTNSAYYRYNPVGNLWTYISRTGSPSTREYHTALWTGSEMIIWGGVGSSPTYKQDGGKYNPTSNSWSALSTTNPPSGRYRHTAVFTGNEMIVWGGYGSSPAYKQDGGRYDIGSDTWTSTSTGTNCPTARCWHTAVWTGTEMIIWGGWDSVINLGNGGRYNPSGDSWQVVSTGTNVPNGRLQHVALWTGKEMIIWGGRSGYYNSGGRYAPSTDTWIPTLRTGSVPSPRADCKAFWTGSSIILWGGIGSGGYLLTGGIYCLPSSPSDISNNTSSDIGCLDTGVSISWSAPSNWGDGSSGTRTFDILRDGTPLVTGLSESTLSYIDTTGDNGVSYLYQVRANNGCGLSTTTTGSSAADNIGAFPGEVANFNDVYSWDAVSGADGYRLYRGTLADLPNLMILTADGCLRYEGTTTSYDLSGDDPSQATGNLYWYLVTAYTGTCEGTAGDGTGFTRLLSSSGSCP